MPPNQLKAMERSPKKANRKMSELVREIYRSYVAHEPRREFSRARRVLRPEAARTPAGKLTPSHIGSEIAAVKRASRLLDANLFIYREKAFLIPNREETSAATPIANNTPLPGSGTVVVILVKSAHVVPVTLDKTPLVTEMSASATGKVCPGAESRPLLVTVPINQ